MGSSDLHSSWLGGGTIGGLAPSTTQSRNDDGDHYDGDDVDSDDGDRHQPMQLKGIKPADNPPLSSYKRPYTTTLENKPKPPHSSLQPPQPHPPSSSS